MFKDLDKLCLTPDQPIREGIRRMNQSRLGIILVVNGQRELVGTITDGDVRRAALANTPLDAPIDSMLQQKRGTTYAKPISAKVGQPSKAYLKLLKQHSILHLPLVDEKKRVVGLAKMEDFIGQSELPVHALLMAGGAGTRLHPLTAETPKPMLPVGDKPLMEIIIRRLSQSGIRNVKISTHHEREKISNHFKDGRDFDVDVSYIDEDRPLGTAGSLGLIKDTSQTLLVMNGDILTDIDFRSMLAYHREHNADMTVAVRQYDIKVPYGVVTCEDHSVTGIQEKPIFNFFVNAGIYLIEPTVLSSLPKAGQKLEMTDFLNRLVKEKRRVVSFPVLEQWLDIGQPADYQTAQSMAKDMGLVG